MSDIKEEISSLMDGEITNQDEHTVLDRVKQNEELGGMWSRFHAIRSVLQENRENQQIQELLNKIIKKDGD